MEGRVGVEGVAEAGAEGDFLAGLDGGAAGVDFGERYGGCDRGALGGFLLRLIGIPLWGVAGPFTGGFDGELTGAVEGRCD